MRGKQLAATATIALLVLLFGPGCRSMQQIQAPGPPEAVVSIPPRSLPSGRIVDAGMLATYPVLVPRVIAGDDLAVLRLQDSSVVGFYTYPPGTVGHTEGCQIQWEPNFPPARSIGATNVWFEPCGGSMWDPSGHRLFGPSPRDLDTFPVTLDQGRVSVDTRELKCTAAPCERVHDLAIVMRVTATQNGFSPNGLIIPASRPIDLILKNNSSSARNLRVIGIRSTQGTDIQVPIGNSGSQYGTVFTIPTPGTYEFVDDSEPVRFKGTLSVR